MNSAKYAPSLEITVLTETCRTQYMEYQVNALKNQTFRAFEWILVDDNFKANKDWISSLIEKEFPYTHIQPKEIKPYFATAAAINDGLCYTQGELVIFLVDYVIPTRTCLERHWEIYQKYPKALISGSTIPLMNDGAMKMGVDWRAGLFKSGFFRYEELEDDLIEGFQDDKGVQNWWMGRNDSIPLEALLHINGLDEQFDGCWGGQDAEVAQRLMTCGFRYIIDTSQKSLCLEHPHKHGAKPAIRSDQAQQALQNIIDERIKFGIYDSGNERNLREERKICLKL